jgi:hypothetical protein
MKYEIAAALGLLVITAVSGAVAALTGATDAALLIWVAGGITSVSIVFLAPWVIHFFGHEDAPGV